MKFTRETLRNVMKTAWLLFRSGRVEDFKTALKKAWMKYKLILKLKSTAEVKFVFKKLDKSIREAVGTLKEGHFFYEKRTTDWPKNPLVVTYHDLEKDIFRKCRIENILSIG